MFWSFTYTYGCAISPRAVTSAECYSYQRPMYINTNLGLAWFVK